MEEKHKKKQKIQEEDTQIYRQQSDLINFKSLKY
jgi:hypothetical protein